MSNNNLTIGVVAALLLGGVVGWIIYPSQSPTEPNTALGGGAPQTSELPTPQLDSIERKIGRLTQGVQIAIVGAMASLLFAYLSWVKKK